MDSDLYSSDICRVCRSEGLPDRPLFHPCICTGSIKWIHQECLVQWMLYSRKEYCELCSHRFSFTPIYSPDMPRRLPLKDLASGLMSSVATAVKYWLHFTLVATAWLGIVPITSCRIYRFLFSDSFEYSFSDFLSTENIALDILHGCFIVTCTLFSFLGLIWLREQILLGGGPDWLERDNMVMHVDIRDAAVQREAENQNNNEMILERNEHEGGAPEIELGQNEANLIHDPARLQEPENGENPNEDNNWIPMEWDRAAEELSWERLLGLDGSLLFLEHIFWVVSLNTLFVLIFAFLPYVIGFLFMSLVSLREKAMASHFDGLVTTLIGYCLVGILCLFLHRVAAWFQLPKTRRLLGMCYVVVKVAMLSVVEIGILPLICGWWLDICSLSMFDASLKDRENSFRLAPGTSIFIHWLVGMVYVYYLASFVLLLREILRPGVLWFLRNLNDPDFSPIQEMIHLPILRHIRRLLSSAVIFGSVVLLMLYVPIRMLRYMLPSFLPYTISLNGDLQVNELSLELLLLQVILPALLEQGHTRTWLKALIRIWCRMISWILDLHSYLLGDDEDMQERVQQQQQQQQRPQPPEVGGGLGAAHQALHNRDTPTGFRPYCKPPFFGLRIVLLLTCVCVSLIASSLVALTLPVWIGRRVMSLWVVGTPSTTTQVTTAIATTSMVKVHELYTAACGTYLCWLTLRGFSLILSWLPQGRAAMLERLRHWCVLGVKTFIASIILLGVIPLLFGLLLELVVIIPLRVPLHQTPLLFIWQDWALGVLYTKIACAITMMGPDWALRTAIERAYRDGIREMNLMFIFRELAAPVVISCGLGLAIPYVIANSLVPLVVTNMFMRNIIARRIYPFLLLIGLTLLIVSFQIRQFKKLYEHIKNDKYLVGQRLVNYDHRRARSRTTSD